MAKPLVFLLGEDEIAVTLNKIDRSRLYGFKEVEAVDEHGEICQLATLADDGRTLIPRGGTGLVWTDAEGAWCEKSELKPVNVDGNELVPVQSSFNAPIKLFDTATVDEYLNHNIRLAYSLSLEGTDDNAANSLMQLRSELQRGTIFAFAYSYRGGLEADAAFLLLSEEGEIMLAVGSPTQVAFVGIQAPTHSSEEDSPEDSEEELMDFDMI